jgi:hypothetical protein
MKFTQYRYATNDFHKTDTLDLGDTQEAYELATQVFEEHENAVSIEMKIQVNQGYVVTVKDRDRIIYQLKSVQ